MPHDQSPSPVSSVAILASQGTTTNFNGKYVCNLGTLAPVQSMGVTMSMVITNSSDYCSSVSVSSSAPDPDLSDNSTKTTVQGLYFQRPDTVKDIGVAPLTLAYDSIGQRLFAATSNNGTNLVVWFDLQSGMQRGSITVDTAPSALRLTDDGRFLYFFAGSGAVERIQLTSMTVDLRFFPPGVSYITAMAVIPGQPHSVILSYSANNSPVTAIFDDGNPRPSQLATGFMLFATIDATSLYGNTGAGDLDTFRLGITDSGLEVLNSGYSGAAERTEMKLLSGRLFFTDGYVLDTTRWVSESAFSSAGATTMELFPSQNLAAFIVPDPGSFLYSSLAHMYFCTISNRQQIASLNINTSFTDYNSLTWCGGDRFAFCSAYEIIIARCSVLPTADVLKLSVPTVATNGLQFVVGGTIGDTYTLETSTNLSQWNSVTTFVCQSTNQAIAVPFSPSMTASFYRLQFTTNRSSQ